MIYTSKLYEQFHKERSRDLVTIPSVEEFSYRTILPHLDKLLKKGKKVLDIGCGNGSLSFFAASHHCKVLGIDVSNKAISGCRLNAQKLGFNERLKFEVNNFDNPQLEINTKFDLVICSEVLEHLKNDTQALKRIYDLLKPGGKLFLSTPSVNAPLHNFRLILFKKDYFDEEVGHLRRYDLQQLTLLLKRVNFRILVVKKTEGFLRNFFYVTKLGTKFQRFLRPPFSDIVSFLDNRLLFLGESDLIVIATKSI